MESAELSVMARFFPILEKEMKSDKPEITAEQWLDFGRFYYSKDPADLEQAKRCFEKATEAKEADKKFAAEAWFNLGVIHEAARPAHFDPDFETRARELYENGHKLGEPKATVNLAVCHWRNGGANEAVALLTVSKKAKENKEARSLEAIIAFNNGMFALHNFNSSKDKEKEKHRKDVIRYFEEAGNKGLADAYVVLAIWSKENESFLGVSADERMYYGKALALGWTGFVDKFDVLKDTILLVKEYRISGASAGRDYSLPYEAAKKLYTRGAQLNIPEGCLELGNLYSSYSLELTEKNKGAVDFQKAIENYEKAGQLGLSEGYIQLGKMYSEGLSVRVHIGGLSSEKLEFKVNKDKAAEYYIKAAQLGNVEAVSSLEKFVKNNLFSESDLRPVIRDCVLKCLNDNKVTSDVIKLFKKLKPEFLTPDESYQIGQAIHFAIQHLDEQGKKQFEATLKENVYVFLRHAAFNGDREARFLLISMMVSAARESKSHRTIYDPQQYMAAAEDDLKKLFSAATMKEFSAKFDAFIQTFDAKKKAEAKSPHVALSLHGRTTPEPTAPPLYPDLSQQAQTSGPKEQDMGDGSPKHKGGKK